MPYDRAWEKAPPYDRAWEKTCHILGICAYTPCIDLNILSIEQNIDIPGNDSIYWVYSVIYQVYS
jgi:hypothetical protein